MGTRQNRLSEGVLTCTNNLCFEQKYENYKKKSTENCHFYSGEILQFILYLEKLSIQFALLQTLSISDTDRCQGKFYDIDWV